MKRGIKGDTVVNKKIKQARSAFKNHTMKIVGPGHWRMWNPKDKGHFWVDVVVMGDCGLAVWGDIDGCFFSYYSNPKNPEELVHWIGGADPWYYGRQKAHIGMGGAELIDSYDDDVAIYDLNERLRDAEDEQGEYWNEPAPGHAKSEFVPVVNRVVDVPSEDIPSIGAEYTEAVDDAIEAISNGQPLCQVKHDFYDAISTIDQDAWEWLGSVGRIPSSRLIYTITAVRRLSQLLERERKKKSKKDG